MRQYMLICIGLVTLIAGVALDAAACSCMPQQPPSQAATDEALANAAAVFLGYPVVIRLEPGPIAIGGLTTDPRIISLVRTQFRVLRSWKGADNPLIWIDEIQARGCEYPFEIRTNYLVYAHRRGGNLTTSTCSRTRPETDAFFEMERLGAPRAIFPESEGIKW